MLFWVENGVGRRMGVLDEVVIVEREGAVLGGKCGHRVVTDGTLLYSCVRAMCSSQITLGRTCL